MKGKRIITQPAKAVLITVIGIFCLFLYSCRMTVSLTGGTINPNAKTVYIATFPNNATLVNPSLSQDFTNALKNKIQNQTPLTIVNNEGDYSIEGEITGYNISPIAVQGNETAAMNRLTITVRVRFSNRFDENQNFEESFSHNHDYNSTINFTSMESTFIAEINDVLTDKIFNRAFVNW